MSRSLARFMVRLGASLLAMPLVTASGCTLVGLDDFELPRCVSNSDCAALNEAEGIAQDACELYLCEPVFERCVLGPRDLDQDGFLPSDCGGDDCDDLSPFVSPSETERCDAVDNDCDLRVDEGVTGLGEVTPIVTGLPDAAHVGWTTARAETPAVAIASASSTGWLVSTDDRAVLELGYTHEADDRNPMRPEMVAGCPRPSDGGTIATSCSFSQMDVAEATDGGLFTAVIHDRGCREGQLRVGMVDRAVGPDVQLRGPALRSNLYLGVDIDWSERPCSGASRGGSVGASAVSVASHGSQAMVAYIGDSLERPACGAASAPVEVMGVFDERGRSGGTDIRWVTGTANGAPQTLGQTVGSAAPALAAVEEAYVVGFAADASSVALYVVPRPDAPAALPVSPTGTEQRDISALAISGAAVSIAAPRADFLTLAAAPAENSIQQVGLIWREGCEEEAPLWFALLQRRGLELMQVGAPTRVTERATPGATIAHQPGAAGEGDAFVIAWGSASGLGVAQVAVADGAMREEPVVIPTSGPISAPQILAGAAGPRVLLLEDDRRALSQAALSACIQPDGEL